MDNMVGLLRELEAPLEDDWELPTAPHLGVDRLGPVNAAEAFMWPATLCHCIKCCMPTWWHAILQILTLQGRCLNTDYSGVGTPETVVGWIDKYLLLYSDALGRVVVMKAGDIKEQCRKVLLFNRGDQASRAVFGDALARMPQTFKELYKDICTNVSASNIMGVALAAARQMVERDHPLLTGYCYKAVRRVALQATRPGYEVSMNVAGFICVDWSTRGKGRKWAGASALVFLQWVIERFILQEYFCLRGVRLRLRFHDPRRGCGPPLPDLLPRHQPH